MTDKTLKCLGVGGDTLGQQDPTLTVDTFIGEVPVDAHRAVLVFLREHGGKRYVRWRMFHKHRQNQYWYPDKRRAFVVPVDAAVALGNAIAAAVGGQPVSTKPEWLQAINDYCEHRYQCLKELNAPPHVIEEGRRKMLRIADGSRRSPSRRHIPRSFLKLLDTGVMP